MEVQAIVEWFVKAPITAVIKSTVTKALNHMFCYKELMSSDMILATRLNIAAIKCLSMVCYHQYYQKPISSARPVPDIIFSVSVGLLLLQKAYHSRVTV